MALVEFTPLSANGLYLIVNKRKTTGISQLFTELQDEKTKQVLKHNAIYKSFWFTDSKSDADEEATGESLAVVKTLVRSKSRPFYTCVLNNIQNTTAR